jgi:hypothetical protein
MYFAITIFLPGFRSPDAGSPKVAARSGIWRDCRGNGQISKCQIRHTDSSGAFGVNSSRTELPSATWSANELRHAERLRAEVRYVRRFATIATNPRPSTANPANTENCWRRFLRPLGELTNCGRKRRNG